MSDLKFVDTHNLVAYLEKPTKSEGFEEIVDFLNANPIKYALIVNPTICWGYRKQKSKKSKKKNIELPQPSGSIDNVPDENKVLDLEKAKTAQDSEIASLKKNVKKLERRNNLRTLGLKRLRKVGSARRVESSDEASLGDQEDASKHRRKIADIDADAETLIEIKAVKPKVRGVIIQEPSEFTTTTPAALKPLQDKGKAKMIESEKPLKKKDRIMYDQKVALNLQAQLQAKLEEERLARQKEEEANIALIES
ncbi:hypothetical protein Tco_0138661 [Tanacetum coccineum]